MGNKLREMFETTPEEIERLRKMYDESAKKKGCSTCHWCVPDTKHLYPDYVTAERNKCLKGLECDTVLFRVKNCPQYIKRPFYSSEDKREEKI